MIYAITKRAIILAILYILLLIIDLVLLYTYLDGGITYWLDSNFPFDPTIWLYKVLFYYWNSPFFPGGELFFSQDTLFIGILIFIFNEIFRFSLTWSEFLYLLFFIYLSQIGFMKLISIILKLLHEKHNPYVTLLGGLIGGLLYSWGAYSYSPPILGINYPFFVFYSLFPLALYFIIKYIFIENEFISLSLITLYIIFLSGAQFSAPTYLLWAIIIYLSIVLPLWLLVRKVGRKRFALKNAIIGFVTIIAGLEQLYQTYIASLGAFYVGVHNKFLGKPIVISELESQYHSFNLYSYLSYLSPEKFEIIGFLLLAFTFTGILMNDRIMRYFSSFLLITFLLIVGASTGVINLLPLYSLHFTPVGIIAVGLMYSVQYIFSGFPAFFTSSLVIGYSIPILITKYIMEGQKQVKRLATIAVLTLVISSSFYIYSFRIGNMHGEFRAFNLPVNATNVFYPPQELFDVGEYLSDHAGFYNVIEFPLQYAAGMYDANGTKAIWYTIDPLSDYIMGQLIRMPTDVTYPLYQYFPSFNLTNVTNFFVLLGAKYVVLNKQAYPGPGVPLGYAGGYPWNFTKFIDALTRTPNVTLVEENKYYNVYLIDLNVSLIYPSAGIAENLSYAELFFLYSTNKLQAQKESVIYGNGAINITNISGVHVRVITNYWNEIITIQVNASRPFYLIFDEGYSPLWALTVNGVVNNRHYIANGYANAWLMPPGNYVAEIRLTPVNTIQAFYVLSFLGLFVIVIIYLIKNVKYIKNRLTTPRLPVLRKLKTSERHASN